MATIINNPDSGSGDGAGMGTVIGIIAVVIIIVLFFVYGLPALRGTKSGTTVNVPEKVQVDVNSDTTN